MKLDFSKMRLYEKVFWRVRLWLMDHNPFFPERHWCLLEPSYYYLHTEEECEKEKGGFKGAGSLLPSPVQKSPKAATSTSSTKAPHETKNLHTQPTDMEILPSSCK